MTFAQPFSEYEVLDRVGAGSMGTVFKARHKKLNRLVALKVLKPSLGGDSRYVERLRREARIVASLNHPNIVTGYDLGCEGGYHFFVMEFVDGKSLRELLSEWGLFAEERVLDVAMQITIALDHAFEHGVIHRDIKPANILIAKDNVVKLTDMGLAKGPEDLTITRDGATVGTPQYISPEQAKDSQDVDVRSDLYSLGATLFHMCTGQPPFRAESMANVLVKVLRERAPSAAGFNPDLSDGLNLIIRKLLSKDPARRYQEPRELLADLERVQRMERPKVEERDLDSGEETDRKPLLWIAGVVVALLLGWVGWSVFRAPTETPIPPGRDLALYEKRMRDGLRKDPTTGAMLRHVEDLLGGVVDDPGKKEILVRERDRLSRNLEDEVITLVRVEARDLEETFEGLGWTDPQAELMRRIDTRVREKVGVQAAMLPASAQGYYREELKKLTHKLAGLGKARAALFRQRVDEHGKTILDGLREALRSGDIARAQTRFDYDLAQYDVLAGSPPRERLPEDLRRDVIDAETKTRHEGARRIAVEEKALLHRFESGLAALDGILRRGERNPADALREFDGFAKDLERDFPPPTFRPEKDPWPLARDGLKEARLDLARMLKLAQERDFRTGLKIVYEAALHGEFGDVRKQLEFWARHRVDPGRIQAHVDLLRHAEEVQKRLMRVLRTKGRLGTITARDGRTVRVKLVAGVLKVTDRPWPLAWLRVSELVEKVDGDFVGSLPPDGRAGLALLYFLSMDRGYAKLLDGDYEKLFQDDLVDLPPLKQRRTEFDAARKLLTRVPDQVQEGRFRDAQVVLQELRRDHVEFAAVHKVRLDRIAEQIARGLQRVQTQARLQRRQKGVDADVDDALRVAVHYDMKRVAYDLARTPSLVRAWNQDKGGPIRATDVGPALDSAREQQLHFDSLLEEDKPVTASVELSFPEEGAAGPRLVFLTCHGATVGMGLTRAGVLAAFPVNSLDDGKYSKFADRIAKSLVEAEASRTTFVLPGVRYRFRLRVRQKSSAGDLATVELTMDGVLRRDGKVIDGKVLLDANVRRPAQPRRGLSIVALNPLTVHSVGFRWSGVLR